MRLVLVLFAASSLLNGCNKPSSASTNAENASSAASSQPAIAFNETEFRNLADRVTTLEGENAVRKFIEDAEGEAFLKPANREWSAIKTQLGYVIVSLSNVAEYANGSEVTLQFGNPTTATLSGVSAHLEWGKLDDKGTVVGQKFEKDVSFAESIPSGTWQPFKVTLSDISPKELGYVQLKNLQFKSIALRQSYSVGN